MYGKMSGQLHAESKNFSVRNNSQKLLGQKIAELKLKRSTLCTFATSPHVSQKQPYRKFLGGSNSPEPPNSRPTQENYSEARPTQQASRGHTLKGHALGVILAQGVTDPLAQLFLGQACLKAYRGSIPGVVIFFEKKFYLF